MTFYKKHKRSKKKLRACVEEMYGEFDTLLESHRGDRDNKTMSARDFHELLNHRYSIKTIMKAKHLLGIRSEKMRGHFYWHLPTHTPEGVSQQYHDKRVETLDKLQKEAYASYTNEWEKPGEKNSGMVELRDHMINTYRCDGVAKEVYAGMSLMFCRKTIFEVKKHLMIKSVKTKEGWRWVYASKEAIDYLERRLFSGPVPVERLEAEFQRKGWSRHVLNLCREQLGGIKFKVINGKFHWYDINRTASVTREENSYVP